MDIGQNIHVDGSVTATGKLRGGQASQAGDAVLLGSDGKIPRTFYEEWEVEDFGFMGLKSHHENTMGIVIEGGTSMMDHPQGIGVFFRRTVEISGSDIPLMYPYLAYAAGQEYPSSETFSILAVINGMFTDNTDEVHPFPPEMKIYQTLLLVEFPNDKRLLVAPDGASWDAT